MSSVSSVSSASHAALRAMAPSPQLLAAGLNLPQGYSVRYRIGTGPWIAVVAGTRIPRVHVTIEILHGTTPVLTTGATWGAADLASGATGSLRITTDGIIIYTPRSSSLIHMPAPTLPAGYQLEWIAPAPKPPVVISPPSMFTGFAAGTVGKFRIVHGSGPTATFSAPFNYSWNSNSSISVIVPVAGSAPRQLNLTFARGGGVVTLSGSLAPTAPTVPIGYDNLASLGYSLAWVSPAQKNVPVTSTAFPGLYNGEKATFVLLGPGGEVSQRFTYAWNTAANITATFPNNSQVAIAFSDSKGAEHIVGRKLVSRNTTEFQNNMSRAIDSLRLRLSRPSSSNETIVVTQILQALESAQALGIGMSVWNPLGNYFSITVNTGQIILGFDRTQITVPTTGGLQLTGTEEAIREIVMQLLYSDLVNDSPSYDVAVWTYRYNHALSRQVSGNTLSQLANQLEIWIKNKPSWKNAPKSIHAAAYSTLDLAELTAQTSVFALLLTSPTDKILNNVGAISVLQEIGQVRPGLFSRGFVAGNRPTAADIEAFQKWARHNRTDAFNYVGEALWRNPNLISVLLASLNLSAAAAHVMLASLPPPPPPPAGSAALLTIDQWPEVKDWAPTGDARWTVPFGEIDPMTIGSQRHLPIGFSGELSLENAAKQCVGILKIANWGGKDANGKPAAQSATMLTPAGAADPWKTASIVARKGGGYTIQIAPKSTASAHLASVSNTGVATFYFGPRPTTVEGKVTVSSPIWTEMNRLNLSPIGGTLKAPTLLKYSTAIAALVKEYPNPAALGAAINAHMIAWGLSAPQQEQVKIDAEILLGCSNDQAVNIMKGIATDVKYDGTIFSVFWQKNLEDAVKPLQNVLHQMMAMRYALDGSNPDIKSLAISRTNSSNNSGLAGFFHAVESVTMPTNVFGVTTKDVIGVGTPTRGIFNLGGYLMSYRSINEGIFDYSSYHTADSGVLTDWGFGAFDQVALHSSSLYATMSKATSVAAA